MTQGKFTSFDGQELVCYLFECEKPKKVIQIAHGMQEYSKTYFEFASFLQKNGYTVFLFDQRAHGKTAMKKDLGKVKGDIFEKTVNDHLFATKMLKDKYNLPIVFIGHSYGSFIGQKYLQVCKDYEKIVLIGSSYMKTLLIRLAKLIAGIQKTFLHIDKPAKLIESLSLKRYPKYFKDASWITSDEEETKKFYSDELNGSVFSIGFYYYMFKNQLKLYNKKSLNMALKTKPILITSGEDDPVGNFGKGTKKLYEVYKKYGFNVSLKMYENLRHGILQEKNKEKVYEDILNFIEK